jgi:hypothetical protein
MKTFKEFCESLEEQNVVYHGSPKDFDQFTPTVGKNSTVFGSEEVKRHGFFFTPSKNVANDYAGEHGKIHHAVLDMKKPFDMRHCVSENMENDFEKAGGSTRWLHNHQEPWERFDGEDGEHFVSILKRAGYDSAIIHEHSPHSGEKHESHIVFHPSQIKVIGKSDARH